MLEGAFIAEHVQASTSANFDSFNYTLDVHDMVKKLGRIDASYIRKNAEGGEFKEIRLGVLWGGSDRGSQLPYLENRYF